MNASTHPDGKHDLAEDCTSKSEAHELHDSPLTGQRRSNPRGKSGEKIDECWEDVDELDAPFRLGFGVFGLEPERHVARPEG